MSPRRVSFTLAALVLAAAVPAWAAVWKRTRPDGTVEFTNMPPSGKSWKKLKDAGRGGPSGRSRAGIVPAPSASETVIWTRENEDGTVEFTNLPPAGGRWRVLYRTGPGKASALRGASDIIPPRDTSSARLSRYDGHIRDQQAIYGIPPALLKAVMKVESDFDPHVVSSAGAVGLMQLIPETARSMGVTDLWDPRQNIMGGARYLQTLARRFCRTPAGGEGAGGGGAGFLCSRDELVRVLAGYHAGPGAVEKYGGLPPFETTRAYVTMVLARHEQYRARDSAPPEGAPSTRRQPAVAGAVAPVAPAAATTAQASPAATPR